MTKSSIFVYFRQYHCDMAGFVATRNEVGMKNIDTTASIPNNPRARLMYYLKSVLCVLELDNANLTRLTNYSNYYLLDDEDIDLLLTHVCLFSPDEFIGNMFFHSEDCSGSNNKLYELSSVTHLLAVAESVLVGGQ